MVLALGRGEPAQPPWARDGFHLLELASFYL